MTPNDPKLSDGSERRDGCAGEGGGAAGVTRTDVRCSAWLGVDGLLTNMSSHPRSETIVIPSGSVSVPWQYTPLQTSFLHLVRAARSFGQCGRYLWWFLRSLRAVLRVSAMRKRMSRFLACAFRGFRWRQGYNVSLVGDVKTPNDPKLSDGGGLARPLHGGGKAAAEAAGVTCRSGSLQRMVRRTVGLGRSIE